MKYNAEQKERLKDRYKPKSRVKFYIENKRKNNFPIKVEIKDGFYIIESQFNAIDL